MDKKRKTSISYTLGAILLAAASAIGWVISVEVRLAVRASEAILVRESMHRIEEKLDKIEEILMKGVRK